MTKAEEFNQKIEKAIAAAKNGDSLVVSGEGIQIIYPPIIPVLELYLRKRDDLEPDERAIILGGIEQLLKPVIKVDVPDGTAS